ncbi:MAG: ATP-binding protein, partial [Pseudomonadales bacterium]|nr:ATP-binding protein [Pseudomonadales bacterium]
MHSNSIAVDNKKAKTYLLKLIASLTIIFTLIGIGLYSFTYRLSAQLTQKAALNDAKIYARALEEFRTLYTSEVVNIEISQVIKVTHDYRATEGAIPLPATLSMLLGQKIGEQNNGANTRLYSPYPFPWRESEGGLKDSFSKQAWQFLQQNPEQEYSQFEQLDGRSILRYAKADIMRESCVDCHNSHPLTPKDDWQLGDVRGILEVTIPLEAATAYSKQALSGLFWIILAISMLGIFTISYFAIKIRRSTAIIETSAIAKEQLNHLNAVMAGVQEVAALSDNILKFLAPILGANQAAMFLLNNQIELDLVGSYARTDRQQQNHYKFGEGLVGQAAVNKSIAIVDNVPENYLQISSGLGSSIPCSLLLFPVLQDDQVIAVLEFASFNTYHSRQAEFLQQIQETLAIALQSAKSREVTNQLLKTNQLNVLELKDQKHRLQSSNDELETQTQQLKKSEEGLKCSEEELKVQSEELKASNEELEEKQQALTLQTEQLQRSHSLVEAKAEQLTLASKYKSEFLANMSHELRTPLNSMLILSKSLYENQTGNLTKDQVEEADIVYQGGQTLLALINDIMDLSKVEAGMLSLSSESFFPGDVKHTLKALFTPVAKSKNLDFEITVDERLTQKITTDKHRLEQVLKNFLSNAFKFTEQGSVKLDIHPAPDTASLQQQDCVCFSVIDTGIGIAEHQQQDIFAAFQQADGGSNRKYGGTGLGLSISKELAQLLGGKISLISKTNMGSKFCLTLPLHSPDNSNPLTAVASSPESVAAVPQEITDLVVQSIANDWLNDDRNTAAEHEPCLLLIEDDRAFSKILIDLIHSLDSKVIATNKGREGLMLALEFAPTGILLDLGLPDISGLRVLEQLKNNLQTRHIPVHVISAGNNKMESLHQGAISYLQKPADAEAITSTLLEI